MMSERMDPSIGPDDIRMVPRVGDRVMVQLGKVTAPAVVVEEHQDLVADDEGIKLTFSGRVFKVKIDPIYVKALDIKLIRQDDGRWPTYMNFEIAQSSMLLNEYDD